jgi:hypothetical protein
MTTYTILGSAPAAAGVYALACLPEASVADRSRRSQSCAAWRRTVRDLGTAGFGHGTTMANPQTKRPARHLGTIPT